MVIENTTNLLPSIDTEKVMEKLSVFRPWVVYVFGSASRGGMRADSDIDLAFLSETPSHPMTLYEVANDLAEHLGREVDLVDLSRASTVMRKEVIRTGTVLAQNRPDKRAWFEMKTLSEYARLNEQRAPVLEKMKGRKTMIDDVHLNKTAIIRRCMARIHEEYRGDADRLEDYTVQDSIMLNLLRACEASIDLAMHEVAKRSLGIPQSSRDAFLSHVLSPFCL